MAALYPGARADKSVATHDPNPVVSISPAQARRLGMGVRPRPAYAPPPAPPSREEIRYGKHQILGHRKALDHAKERLAGLEALLDRADPQRVLAVAVVGYTDPPERVARAEADKAAGVVSVLTREHVAEIKAGRMAAPTFGGPAYSELFHAKREIVTLLDHIAHIEGHNHYIEDSLSRLDPNHVIAARVPGFADAHDTVARADAAKAAGSPQSHPKMA